MDVSSGTSGSDRLPECLADGPDTSGVSDVHPMTMGDPPEASDDQSGVLGVLPHIDPTSMVDFPHRGTILGDVSSLRDDTPLVGAKRGRGRPRVPLKPP